LDSVNSLRRIEPSAILGTARTDFLVPARLPAYEDGMRIVARSDDAEIPRRQI
jgi:hypothetical protein